VSEVKPITTLHLGECLVAPTLACLGLALLTTLTLCDLFQSEAEFFELLPHLTSLAVTHFNIAPDVYCLVRLTNLTKLTTNTCARIFLYVRESKSSGSITIKIIEAPLLTPSRHTYLFWDSNEISKKCQIGWDKKKMNRDLILLVTYHQRARTLHAIRAPRKKIL
jgi:hypothetical protein